SLKTVSENVEKDVSSDKNKDANEKVIDVDNLNSEESPAETTMAPRISKRLRSKSGKVVLTDSEPTKT
ncbi:hypothetical protein A2U01_0118758, partial [Trifolium medium]|nr:hypothetical protein [Trifolium medium]